MHANEEILHEENGGTTPETSHRCCMREVISKKLLPEEGLIFFWTQRVF